MTDEAMRDRLEAIIKAQDELLDKARTQLCWWSWLDPVIADRDEKAIEDHQKMACNWMREHHSKIAAATQPEQEGICLDPAHRRHKQKTGEDCTCPKYIRHPNCRAVGIRSFTPQPDHDTGGVPENLVQFVEWAFKTHMDDDEKRDAIIGQIKRAARQPEQDTGGVPEGWKMVPVEPTQQMCEAGDKAVKWAEETGHTDQFFAAPAYHAMLAAAPQPEQEVPFCTGEGTGMVGAGGTNSNHFDSPPTSAGGVLETVREITNEMREVDEDEGIDCNCTALTPFADRIEQALAAAPQPEQEVPELNGIPLRHYFDLARSRFQTLSEHHRPTTVLYGIAAEGVKGCNEALSAIAQADPIATPVPDEHAAIAQIYFDIAAEVLGEDEVRRRRDLAIAQAERGEG